MSLFPWVYQIHPTGRGLKFYENQYLHEAERSTFLVSLREGRIVWAGEWWVALACGHTYGWGSPTSCWYRGAGLVWVERRGPGGCKTSCKFIVVLASFCQHRKLRCVHILMSISRGLCRLEERGETKQALALQFGEKADVGYSWCLQNHQRGGKRGNLEL